jgi:hypothetical protein
MALAVAMSGTGAGEGRISPGGDPYGRSRNGLRAGSARMHLAGGMSYNSRFGAVRRSQSNITRSHIEKEFFRGLMSADSILNSLRLIRVLNPLNPC